MTSTGRKLAIQLTNYINVMCRKNNDFVDMVTGQHRTLQQQAFKLFMQCIKEWSKHKQFDERNATTIQLCKEIMKIENIEAIPFI